MKKRLAFALLSILLLFGGAVALVGAFHLRKPLQSKYLGQAKAFIDNGDIVKAEESLLKAEALWPNEESRFLKGRILLLEGRYKAAIPYLRSSDTAEGKSLLGQAYFMSGQYTEAVEAYSTLDKSKRRKKDWEYLIRGSLKQGEVIDATNFCQEALAGNPENKTFNEIRSYLLNAETNATARVNNYMKSAIWLYENSFSESAIKQLTKAVAIMPGYRDAYILLGDIYLAQDRVQEAQISMEKAMETDPYYYLTYQKLSVIYKRQGMAAKAAQAQAKFKSLDGYRL